MQVKTKYLAEKPIIAKKFFFDVMDKSILECIGTFNYLYCLSRYYNSTLKKLDVSLAIQSCRKTAMFTTPLDSLHECYLAAFSPRQNFKSYPSRFQTIFLKSEGH